MDYLCVRCNAKNKKTSLGLCIVLGIAISWVGSSQLSQATQKDYTAINSPMFMTWYSTVFNVALAAPGLALGKVQIHRELDTATLWRIFGFYLLWLCANYSFTRALLLTSAGVVTSFMGTTPAWVAVGSSLALPSHSSHQTGTIIAVFLTVAGSVLVAQPWGGGQASLGGVLLSLNAALLAACYKVMFKKVFGTPSPQQVGGFLGLIGVYAATFGTGLLWVLLLSEAESVTWAKAPWGILTLTAMLSLAFNYLINYGISFTYPLYISLGTVLGIPLNTGADYYFHGTVPSAAMFAGISLICFGFVIFIAVDVRHKTTFPTTIDEVSEDDDDDETGSNETPNSILNTAHLPKETDSLLQDR